MRTVIIAVLLFGMTVFSGPVEDLQPGRWLAVPNSHLHDVEKKSDEYPDWNGGSSAYYDAMQAKGVHAIIDNWCGGDYDSTANRLLIWGGGHWGYGGNEVYAFDVPTLNWVRLTDPSFPIEECVQIYPDGQPSARHTYGSIAVIEHARRMLGMGASTFCRVGGSNNTLMWIFDFNDPGWTNTVPNGLAVNTWVEDKCTYLSEDGKVYYHSPGSGRRGLYTYDYDSNTWAAATRIGWPESGGCYGKSQTIDTKRRLIVEVGSDSLGRIDVCDLDTVSGGFSKVTTTGDVLPVTLSNPGLAYDPASDRVVAWYYSNDVYVLDMDNLVWTKITSANSVPMPDQSINSGGVYGRFRYMPDYNAFIAVMHVDSPVYIYKLPENLTVSKGAPGRAAGTVKLTAWPNPFKAAVTINYELQITNYELKGAELAIYDINGKRMADLSEKIHNSSFVICNSSSWPAGVYLVRMTVGNRTLSKPLFLMK